MHQQITTIILMMYRAKLIYAKISFVQVLTNISERSHPMKMYCFNSFQ